MADKPLTYRNLNIELTDLRDDGSFGVRITGPDAAVEMRADETERPVYRPDDLAPLLRKLERRKASKEELYALGGKLAGLLMPGRVRERFDASVRALGEGQGLRIRLRIEPLELSALPWEYTHVSRTAGEPVPGDFLALQRRISLTRYENLGAPLKPLEGKETIRIVVALASPDDEPELDVEADERAIAEAIADLKSKLPPVESVVLKSATRDQLLKAIPGCDLFHFAGHGKFEAIEDGPDGKPRKRGRIILETPDGKGDPYDSDQLANVLGNAGVRLVTLGACSTAARDKGGAWTGVAPALVRENIPAVCAMQYKVRDRNAPVFSAFLYVRVLGGFTIDEAIFEGRQAVFNKAGLEDRDWGVPVLYLRAEDGVLFPVPPPPKSTAGEPPLVTLQRHLGTVKGEAVGVEVRKMTAGRIDAKETIDVVESGGKVTTVKIDTLG